MTSDKAHESADLTHVRRDGSSHMVDVSGKAVTTREASASATLTSRANVIDRILTGDLPKGEALSVARIAGIMAAKRTHELIPLCHPLPITKVTIDFSRIAPDVLEVHARVKTEAKTGVEMEALTAASVAALTVYDMIKAVDHLAVIGDVKVLAKSGGKSGDWDRAVASGEKGGAA